LTEHEAFFVVSDEDARVLGLYESVFLLIIDYAFEIVLQVEIGH